MNKISLLGVNITNIKEDELNQEIGGIVKNNGKEIVANVNIHAMNIAVDMYWFKEFLNNSRINFCDGEGVRLGARILNMNIVEKITYNRWIWSFANYSELNGLSWYLVGSKPGVIDEATNLLLKKHPKLIIKGFHHGYIGDEKIENGLIRDIKEKTPNVLILGMGMPVQERFLLRNFKELSFNVALTGGAVFDYVSGIAKMTPDIYYKLKIEWLFRFMQEPRRLFYRYFIGNPKFMIRVLIAKIKMIL